MSDSHLIHKQRWEYFKGQMGHYKACLFCKSEALCWTVLGQAFASLYLTMIFEVTGVFANWYLGGCFQFSVNTNVLLSKLY